MKGQETRPRFVLDAMLGSLARWLRLLGYDALYFRDLDDGALASRARRQRRVLVTRDRALAARGSAGSMVLIRSHGLRAQWVELALICGLHPARGQTLIRCGDCNARLVNLSRERVRDRVPPYVFATRRRFRGCPGCGRVFWRATHMRGIEARLSELLAAARSAHRRRSAARRKRARQPAATMTAGHRSARSRQRARTRPAGGRGRRCLPAGRNARAGRGSRSR
ncbi:MAG: Mut7-C RNAse domain-containing protein [Acidobacteriota bacterium]